MTRSGIQFIRKQLRVTDYLSSRDYLRDLYALFKRNCSPYSYLSFAEDLGFSPSNSIRLIVAGKRRQSTASAATIVAHLGLRGIERRYYLLLVAYSNARSEARRAEITKQLLRLKEEGPSSPQEKLQIQYFSAWYHAAVHEVVRVHGTVPSVKWVAQQIVPHVTPAQVADSVELLVQLGVLARAPNGGSIRIKNSRVMIMPADQTVHAIAIARLHQVMLELASAAITAWPTAERELNALTLGLTEAQWEQLKLSIREFCASALALESSEPSAEPKQVVQLNIQLFPLTKSLRSKEAKTTSKGKNAGRKSPRKQEHVS